VPRSIEAEFERELEVFRGETEGALQFFYAWLTVHAVAAEDRVVLRAMNRTPLFWNTTLGALQATTFIVLGRIFDPDTRNHSVSRLLSLAHANMGIFSRSALADRKRRQSANADEWLPEYLRTVYEPTTEDFRRLKRYVAERRRLYQSNYRDLRHLVFAHRSQTDEAQREALFARINIRELQKILAFLARLYEALWQLHFNGAKPTLRPQPYSVQRIRERPQPRHTPSRVQEKIVHETEQLLKTVASAA
jgi:hypothetical protein